MRNIVVRLDRVQLVSWAPRGRKPPRLKGFAITQDSFVRTQTTTATYARCRQYKSLTNDAKIFWQYYPRKGWLKRWKITLVGDDESGLTRDELERVLNHCNFFRFLLLEVAIDFSRPTAVNRRFIREHAVLGKSQPRANRNKSSRLVLR
jgi:hypothetical protein